MNKRITELVEQQGFAGPNFLMSSQELEKFALLIVRECADLFEIEYGESPLSGNDVSRVIKKHFGV